jgi:hypothetical protein
MSMVAFNESIAPTIPTSALIAPPIPTAVSSVRRGARRTFRTGIRLRLLPCSVSRFKEGDRPPPFAARCPVRKASTGATRTARHTGHRVASIVRAIPSTAASRNSRGWNGVSNTGSGSSDTSTSRNPAATTSPTPTPNTTPSTAISSPISIGRIAIDHRDWPKAMPTPSSRRFASTIRLVRLNAANTAAPKISSATASIVRWSLRMSPYRAAYTGSCSIVVTVTVIEGNARSSAAATATRARSRSTPGSSRSTRSFTVPSAPARRWATGSGASTAAKFASAMIPPLSVITMKYSGVNAVPTYGTRPPPGSPISPEEGNS